MSSYLKENLTIREIVERLALSEGSFFPSSRGGLVRRTRCVIFFIAHAYSIYIVRSLLSQILPTQPRPICIRNFSVSRLDAVGGGWKKIQMRHAIGGEYTKYALGKKIKREHTLVIYAARTIFVDGFYSRGYREYYFPPHII